MTLPIHDRSLPPYVHNLVVEAGRDSVFWASARDPGERPDTGGSMSEWRNRVVGSSQEATQSTASNQPIWRGGEVEFGGDDYTETSASLYDQGQATALVVLTRASGSSSLSVTGAADLNSSALLWLSTGGDASAKVNIDDGSTRINAEITGLDLTTLTAVAAQTDWSQGLARISVYEGGSVQRDSATSSSISTTPSLPPPYIGGIQTLPYPLQGDLYEILLAPAFLDTTDVDRALKQLAQRWGV